MNQDYGSSAYFASESDARLAADDLRERGYDVDVRSENSHGQNFWESIKNFFSGQQGTDEYGSGAVLMVSGADSQLVSTVVQQYNGRLGTGAGVVDSSSTTGEITGASDVTRTVRTLDPNMASGLAADMGTRETTTGEIDVERP